MVTSIEALDGRLSLGVRAHFHEPESFGAIRVPVDDNLGTLNGAELGEQRLQVGLVDVVGQVAHVQLLGQGRTPDRKQNDPRDAFRVERKGVSAETRGGRKGEGEEQKPDRKEPAVLLGRQTNRPEYNKP